MYAVKFALILCVLPIAFCYFAVTRTNWYGSDLVNSFHRIQLGMTLAAVDKEIGPQGTQGGAIDIESAPQTANWGDQCFRWAEPSCFGRDSKNELYVGLVNGRVCCVGIWGPSLGMMRH